MRVCVLANQLKNAHAGAALATLEFIRACALDPQIEVTACCQSIDRDQLPEDVNLLIWERPSPRPLLWRFKYFHLIRDKAYQLARINIPPSDVCYAQGMSEALAFRTLFPGIPIVTHTGFVLAHREYYEETTDPAWVRPINAWYLSRVERITYRQKSWAHIVSTRLVAEQRRSFYGLDRNFFYVNPYGINISRFITYAPPPQRNMRRELEIPDDAVVWNSTSRLIAWKRTEMVIAALAEVNDPRHYLVIVGDGGCRARLEQQAQDLGVANRVRFTGHSRTPESYYAISDFFVLPSKIESFGLVYAEAMLMGLPCIGWRYQPPEILSCAEDVIADGVTGYCVSSFEELVSRCQQLAADADLRREMGARGREKAQQDYSTESYVKKFKKLVAERFGIS